MSKLHRIKAAGTNGKTHAAVNGKYGDSLVICGSQSNNAGRRGRSRWVPSNDPVSCSKCCAKLDQAIECEK